jgi:mRNA interferase HigB
LQVLAKSALRRFREEHPQAEMPLKVWHAIVSKASWANFAELKATFGTADMIGDSRVIFNICGNKYRLVARISFAYGRVMVKFIGTHKDYDDIDPETV